MLGKLRKRKMFSPIEKTNLFGIRVVFLKAMVYVTLVTTPKQTNNFRGLFMWDSSLIHRYICNVETMQTPVFNVEIHSIKDSAAKCFSSQYVVILVVNVNQQMGFSIS